MMNLRESRNVADRIIAVLVEYAPNDPLLKNFTFSDSGGTVGVGLQMKLSVTPKVIKPFAQEVTQEDVSMGFAPAGTPITYRSSGGVKKAVILVAKRVRYHIQDDTDKNIYTLRFAGATLDKSRMIAPVVV